MPQQSVLRTFKRAEKTFKPVEKRLAGEGWGEHWKTLIATIMSAQTRDEVTIPAAEVLFKKYSSLGKLSRANVRDVEKIIRRINFHRTKSRNIIRAAHYLLEFHHGEVPESIDELVKIPGVGRKTANLVLSECHHLEGICVDTHVHRISNVLGWVHTKNPTETEFALMKLFPKRYWSRINRTLVLWGKKVPGRDKRKLLNAIGL